MDIENRAKPKTATTKGKKRKQYLPYNKAVKKKWAYPLRPGVEGFFITCDGGRERQAAHEAINVIDSFFEELVNGKYSGEEYAELPNKPLNKKITFSYSDDEDEDEDDDEEEVDDEGEKERQDEVIKSDTSRENEASQESLTNKDLDHHNSGDARHGKVTEETNDSKKDGATEETNDSKKDGATKETDDGKKNRTTKETDDGNKDGANIENQADNSEEPPAKKQCLETDTSKSAANEKEKSIDKLIEDELRELGDKSKRRFLNLDSGCNGVIFVQMRKRDGDPGPKDIVQHMMTSAASTRKHMSRFILRVLPVEVACYASEEEIKRAMKPLIERYFPVETENPRKFAVLYEARANSGIDRMKIINTVAKSIPAPHKVDLSNPDMTIVVEIAKTVCLIGVVEKYKELAKYNLRQLTSPKQ